MVDLTDEEILDALHVLEKIKKNQHHAKELSDREVVLRQKKINIKWRFSAGSVSLAPNFCGNK